MDKTRIWTAPDADDLQRFAALELQRYLQRLFNVSAEIVTTAPADPGRCFVLGLVSASHVQRTCGSLPALSPQGHLLRRVAPDTMILAGGGSTAVAWAVYELVERYGVRYLLHGDVFPESPGAFHLPDVDVVLEPILPLRSWRQFNDLPTGPAMWSLAQQQAFIRQIFKLKFNGIYLSLWPQHPFVDYEVRGIRRRSATFLFGQKIPIEADNIGREHLPEGPFLDNPEMLAARTFPEMLEAGRRLLNGILEAARNFGMHTAVAFQPLEFPAEFRPLLKQPTEGIQLGDLTCAERGDLMNPGHIELIRTALEAYLEQWGQVDACYLGLPEHPHADRYFRRCWQELDHKYRLEKDFPLEGLLARGQRNRLIPGGLERAEREFNSAVAMLHFFDRFFAGNDLLAQAAAQHVGINLGLGGNAEPLLPLLDRVLWEGGGISTSLGYTASRAVRSMHYMEGLDASKVPAVLIVTLQDDNIGSVPQVATENIHVLFQALQRLGWRGIFTRHWPIGDLDPTAAYVARASWDAGVTPRAAYEDHFTHVYGAASTESLCQVMRILEDATIVLDLDFLSLFFPILGIMCRSVEAEESMPVGLFHVRAMYEECRRILLRLRDEPGPAAGKAELAYWISRLDFAIQALAEKELLCEGGMQVHAARAAREASDAKEAAQHLAQAQDLYRRAIEAGEAALHAAASQVRDDSDRATLAAYYHFFVREVKEKVAELLGGDAHPTSYPDL